MKYFIIQIRNTLFCECDFVFEKDEGINTNVESVKKFERGMNSLNAQHEL